jgi:N-acetyl-anhydromuramyl-L-alanine amidase AmpD
VSTDDYARAIIAEGQRRGITPRGIMIALATGLVESNIQVYANSKVPESLAIPHDAVGSDGFSVGIFQQQVVMGSGGWWWGPASVCMDPTSSAGLFYDRLAKLDYNGANSPGSYAQAIQQSVFPDRYDQRWGDATDLYNRLAGTVNQPVTPAAPRPDFNEYSHWCDNNQDRGGTKPDLWLIHTQEGDGNADQLADFLISTTGGSNPVSYHYCVSQAPDGGVTVVDVVDTDSASWSVGNSNNRAINLCFAGSYVAWTTDQWMAQSKAIEVAAYLCIKDCLKYGIDEKVIPPPYDFNPPGISDHRYCTEHLKDGNTHVDVGDNFPWPYFTQMIAKWHALLTAGVPAPVPPAPAPVPAPAPISESDRQLLQEVWDQLRGPGGNGWPQLDNKSIVDYLAELGAKVDALTPKAAPAAKTTPRKRT